MSSRIVASGWPSALQALSWSADSELAIGLGEEVDILIPKISLDPTNTTPEEGKWQRVRLVTNQFPESELPLLEPLPWESFCLGEEQSSSNVITLAWAPPGLAKYKRCVLGVLTSNYVLSLWAPLAMPKESASWSRVLVLNNTLRQNFRRLNSSSSKTDTTWRLRSRVKAFSWSPPFRDIPDKIATSTIHRQFLAIANDFNEIVVLRVDRASGLGSTEPNALSARVVLSFTASVSHREPVYGDVLTPTSIIDHVAWGPWWTDSNNIHYSKIAYIVRSQLQIRECKLSFAGEKPSLEMSDEDAFIEGCHIGPLSWTGTVRKTIDRHSNSLADIKARLNTFTWRPLLKTDLSA